jgi:hypothetical protein
MAENTEYQGYNGTLVLTDTGVLIKRGVKGFLLGGGMLRGDKSIPYSSIVAIQLKKAGMTAGYIQLSLKGGSEAKGGLFQSASDENTVNFYNGSNGKFAEAKQLIEERMSQSHGNNRNSGLNDLEKLAELKEKGIITQAEFDAKKKQLLGL